MTRLRKTRSVATLGTLTAAAALLTGLSAASAQTAPGGGSYPGSFLVPGTNTSLSIGGYVKLDAFYDFGAKQGDTVNGGSVALRPNAANPANPGGRLLHGTFRMEAKESRFNIQTRTPTSYGELKTYIEVDFFRDAAAGSAAGTSLSQGSGADANSQMTRLRHAYGTLGPLLAGQTASLFVDYDAIGEQLDSGENNGYMTATSNRRPQIRYTYVAGNGISIAGSVEEPQIIGIAGNAALPAGHVADTSIVNSQRSFTGGNLSAAKMPNFLVSARIDQAWGHLNLKGVVQDDRIYAVPPAGPLVNLSKTGWGVSLSGHVNTFGKDNLKFSGTYGQGLGIYLLGTANETLVWNGDTTAPSAVLPRAWGVYGAYQHWWTDQLRSNVATGWEKIGNQGTEFFTSAGAAGLEKEHWTMHVNLFWSPVPAVDLGIEYIHAYRKVWDGQEGDSDRAQVGAKFKF